MKYNFRGDAPKSLLQVIQEYLPNADDIDVTVPDPPPLWKSDEMTEPVAEVVIRVRVPLRGVKIG